MMMGYLRRGLHPIVLDIKLVPLRSLGEPVLASEMHGAWEGCVCVQGIRTNCKSNKVPYAASSRATPCISTGTRSCLMLAHRPGMVSEPVCRLGCVVSMTWWRIDRGGMYSARRRCECLVVSHRSGDWCAKTIPMHARARAVPYAALRKRARLRHVSRPPTLKQRAARPLRLNNNHVLTIILEFSGDY